MNFERVVVFTVIDFIAGEGLYQILKIRRYIPKDVILVPFILILRITY